MQLTVSFQHPPPLSRGELNLNNPKCNQIESHTKESLSAFGASTAPKQSSSIFCEHAITKLNKNLENSKLWRITLLINIPQQYQPKNKKFTDKN